MRFFDTVLLPALIMLVLDGIFLGMNRDMFALQVAEVQRVVLEIRYLGAVLCYALLIFALYYFIIKDRRPVIDAMLLGFVIYGVYETTTYALLKKWKLQTMMIDTLWGGILFGLTTMITYKLTPIR
jgi:uncharacterized membrane protein